jgi:hypothetical protein
MTFKELKKIRIYTVIFFLILAPLGAYLATITKDSNLKPFLWFIYIIALTPFVYFHLAMWRCPKCKHNLGRSFKEFCSNCGTRITDETKY